jgi:molybdate transport system substrate-binding protein
MTRWHKITTTAGFALSMAISATTTATAVEIKVIASTAMREVLEALGPMFEKSSGNKVTVTFYSGAILPGKVRDGEQADIVFTTPDTIEDLTKAGRLVAGSEAPFVRSAAGVAVRAGARKPDIATPEAFKAALLAAKTVGYSQGPSGVHFNTVIAKLGIADQVKAKGVVPPLGSRVGTLIAEGKAEIGVQQITELLLIPGIDYIGPLPQALQANIVYATATPTNAKEKNAAAALGKFIRSEAAAAPIKKLGLDPA